MIDASLLHATIMLVPDDSGESFSIDKIIKFLQSHNITPNVDQQLIEDQILEVSETGQTSDPFDIVRGTEPVESEDAYYEYPIIEALEKRDTDPDDLTELSSKRIINVREGETVAIFHPKKEGVPGVDIHGAPMPVRQARDNTPKPQKNLTWEHTSLVSEVDGRFMIEKTRLHVTEEVHITGDLTVVFGDIDFVGKLIVDGNIEAGVEVKVKKDLDVKGSIIGCNVTCGGNLSANNSIVGSEETEINVGGDLTTTFVENVNMNVKGLCQVKDSFVTSKLLCSDQLDMTGGVGHFVSGYAAARNGIIVRDVGIPIGTKARLAVGRDHLIEVERKELEEELERLTETLDNIDRVSEKIGPMTVSYQKLPQAKKDEIELLLDQEPLLRKRYAAAKARSDEIYPLIHPAHDKMITVTGSVHPDTILEFPLVRRKVSDALMEVIFVFDDDSCSVSEKVA